MSDPWIVTVQNYINTTYAGTPVGQVEVTGRTGWPTMYALTRALQRELGITQLSSTFGPGTVSALDAYGAIGLFEDTKTSDDSAADTKRKRINNIIRAGLFAKGYNGGNGVLDGTYSTTTIAAVKALRTDMGLAAGDGKMTSKVLKALLTMDAYVLVDGGSSQIRAIQRTLNGRYLNRANFYVLPADGYYSRSVQNALMYAIQYEIGMADGTANGNFGPGTQSGIRTLGNIGIGDSDAASGNFLVHLFQAALTFNGFPVPFDGVFSQATSGAVTNFQSFSALGVSGRGNFQTWASLLVSTGDVNRPGTAADTIRTITPERALTLVANGYQTVGRYLTNSPVADPLDKNIKPGEIQTIFDAGLTIVPIFQEGGDYLDYFTNSRGLYAGQKAYEAARGYGFRPGTTIYFAVDFDAVEDQVLSNVVPYFEGIKSAIGNFYRIGVYGARNTCSIVSTRGLAELSYVSDMSTGYSGNLGFKLPDNWAFDQILEYEIGSGLGGVNIDKNIKSGRDAGQSVVDAVLTTPREPDVLLPTDTSFREQFLDDVETELVRQMTADAEELALMPRRDAANLALYYDGLLTRLSSQYKVRKAFLQTVLVWEAALVKASDNIADAAVRVTYRFLYEDGIKPPQLVYDSSTGPCQIFAETAINAANWTQINLSTNHGIPRYDPNAYRDWWTMWKQLNELPVFNLEVAAVVILEAAAHKESLPLGSDPELLLSPTQQQIEVTLGAYNGKLDYGTRRLKLYNLFESYNAQVRV
jgi:peptidoglycan hydrolase-like protein with peptidoglycan-binding domain